MLPGTSLLSISLSCKQSTYYQAFGNQEASAMASSTLVQVGFPAPIYCIKHGKAHSMAKQANRRMRHKTPQGMSTSVIKSPAREQ